MLTEQDRNEIVDILDEHYYSLGTPSGHEALAVLMSDFFEGFLDENLEEWGVTKHEFHSVIFWLLAKKWLDEKKMWEPHSTFYNLAREARLNAGKVRSAN